MTDLELAAIVKGLAPVVRDVATRAASDAVRGALEPLTKDVGTLRERIAAAEVRPLLPGPPGADGADGANGTNGVDGARGADGLGFDDLAVDFDGDRTLTLAFVRGVERKAFSIRLPFMKGCGTYQYGRTYDAGDVVSWAGSAWQAKEITALRPDDGSKVWTLVVKRGRDGKDAGA